MLQKSYFSLLLILTFSNQILNAQERCTLSIEGYVIDEHDKTPLTNANIFVFESALGCISDEQGYFKVEGLCKGINTITCSHIGCESITKVFDLQENTTYNFILEHHSHLLETIAITAKKVNNNTPSSMQIIDKKTIENNVLSDISTLLSRINGITALKSGGNISKPVLHGMSGNRIKLIHNEIGIEDQQWGNEHAPSIVLTNSEEIQVIKGAGAVKYGSDAIAGAIVISPASIPKGESLSTSIFLLGASANTLSSVGFKIRSSIKRRETFGWNVGGQFSANGDTKTPKYYQTNTGARNYNYHFSLGERKAKMNYRFDYQHKYNESGILRFAHIGNVSDFARAINSATPITTQPFSYKIDAPKQQIHHHTVSGTFNYILNNSLNFKALYGYQSNFRREYDIRRAGRSAIPSLEMHLQTHYIDLEIVDFRKDKFKTNAGIQLQNQSNYNNPRTGVKPLIPNYKTYKSGFFLVEEITLKKIIFEAGFRYDYTYQNAEFSTRNGGKDSLYFDKKSFHNFSYNTGIFWKPSSFFYLKLNTGSAFRNPNMNELYSNGLHHGAAIYEKGKSSLSTEKSINNSFELGIVYPKWALTFNAYHHHFFNYIFKSLNGVTPTIKGVFPLFQYNEIKAMIVGSDISIKYQPLKFFTITHNADYVLGWTLKNRNHLPEIPPVSLNNEIAFRYPFSDKKIQEVFASLSIETVFQVKNQLQIIAPDSLIKFSTEEINTLSNELGFIDFVKPPITYTLLDIEMGIAIKNDKRNINISTGINNLTNHSYRNYMNLFRYFTDETGINFYLKLNFNF